MKSVGTIDSLWRYPVKSMQGEEIAEAFMGFSGFYGDRYYAFRNSAARKGFPYLNANVQQPMLRYRPRFRHPEKALMPPNLIEAMNIPPGASPAYADAEDMIVDVVTPSGTVVAIDDPALIDMLGDGLRGENRLTLTRSDRALTDCRPVSLISMETVKQVEDESGIPIDKRRFRANVYFTLASPAGFAEDAWVGRKLRLGSKAEVAVLERDPRCKMISLDPETGDHNPDVLRHVAGAYANCAGVYCAVLVEGIISKGDSIELLD